MAMFVEEISSEKGKGISVAKPLLVKGSEKQIIFGKELKSKASFYFLKQQWYYLLRGKQSNSYVWINLRKNE